MRAAGFSHEDIGAVVLSHLHFDHAGGLLAPWQAGYSPALLFPNAKFIVGKRAWERACQPHPRDRASFIAELQPLLEASGRLELVENEHSFTLGKHVRFTFSDGHTPGLMLAEVVPGRSPNASEAMDGRERPPGRSPNASEAMDGRERLPGRSPNASEAMDGRERPPDSGVVFCADLIPGRPWVHLPVTMGYDRAAELLIDEKRAFLEDKLARQVRLFFTHDPACALARVTRGDKGRYGTADEFPELTGMAV